MGTISPVAIITTICIPSHIIIHIMFSHVIEFTIINIICVFRQSPTFRAYRAGGFIALIVHAGGSTGSGGSVSVICAVLWVVDVVVGTYSFSILTVLVPAAGEGEFGASVWRPVLLHIAVLWS